jgi:hypothetical protein
MYQSIKNFGQGNGNIKQNTCLGSFIIGYTVASFKASFCIRLSSIFLLFFKHNVIPFILSINNPILYYIFFYLFFLFIFPNKLLK